MQTAFEGLRQRALGQMASGIVHDINNAISPVSILTDLLLDEPGLSDETKHDLNTIKTAIDDIAHIIERMREFYQKRDADEELLPVNLNQLAQQVIELTRPRWKNIPQAHGVAIEMRTDLQPNLPAVRGIESEIREALTNLIFNAVDAMLRGGFITLRTRVEVGNIIIEVCDEGIGMDEETRRRCLEPFYSTKGERGTGLGLAMVYGSIEERHEGRVYIDSEVGVGTTMRLIIPLHESVEQDAILPYGANTPLPPLRILCIDDELLLRESIKRMLTRDEHTVELADGGQIGLDTFHMAKARGEPFDVVITQRQQV